MANEGSGSASVVAQCSMQLGDAVERASNVVVTVESGRRTSSGTHWRPGVVVTAEHTLDDEDDVTIKPADGSKLPAKVAGRDEATDLGVLTTAELSIPTATLAPEAELRVGNLALAVGRSDEGEVLATLGVISVLGEAWNTWRGGRIDRLIRADVTPFFGYSGGVLADVEGRVIGINTTRLSRRFGLTVPPSTVERVVEALLEKGRIARGYLGLAMRPAHLPEQLVESLGLKSRRGVMVFSVERGSPADRASVMLGDVIVRFDDRPVDDVSEMMAFLGPDSVGRDVALQVLRGGKLTNVTVTVGESPCSPP